MNQDTLRKALDRWGTVPQMLMAVEECAELTQALMHYIRGRATKEQVAGEVADVLIMAAQMRMVFGAEDVDRAVEAKMDRLRERVGEAA